MDLGKLLAVGMRNSSILPAGVIRPILFPPSSVNQRLPSRPAAIALGTRLAVGMENSVPAPVGVIAPIWFPPSSVSERAPSSQAGMPAGSLNMQSENS